MEFYVSKFIKLLTALFVIIDSISISWASFDDLDAADTLLNTMASAFVQPNDLGGDDTGSTDECIFTCPNGSKPKRNPDYVVTSNGCGTYGMKLDLSKLPNMEKCCEKHDFCYGTCNKKMAKCNEDFKMCLYNACQELEDDMGLTEDETEGCMMIAQLMFSTVQGFGCGAYLDSQEEACICPAKSNKKKRKTEL